MSPLVPDFSPFRLAEAQSDKDQMGLLTRNFFFCPTPVWLVCPAASLFSHKRVTPNRARARVKAGGKQVEKDVH